MVWGSPVGTEEAYTKTLLESTVPTFRTFTNAVMAAKAYFDHHRFVASYESAFTHPVLRASPARRTARPVIAPGGARRGGGESLSEQDSKALLEAYGIAVPKERVATSAAEAAKAAKKIGYPVVMKIVSPDILHKSDLGLVAVGVRDEDDARRTYKRLLADRQEGGAQGDDRRGAGGPDGAGSRDRRGHRPGRAVRTGRDVRPRRGLRRGAPRRDVPRPPFTTRDATAMLDELRGAAPPRAACAGSRPPTESPWSTC